MRSLISLLPRSFISSDQSPRIEKLILKKNWNALVQIMSMEDFEGDSIQATNEKGQNTLHLACERQPPLLIVMNFARECPESISQLDLSGRTPLHAAVSSGCSAAVIQFLVKKYPKALSLLDINGKTPLILVCENCQLYEPQLLVPVIKIMCHMSPMSVDMEDVEGKSALEYAICAEANRGTVRTLQRAVGDAWKLRKKEKQECAGNFARVQNDGQVSAYGKKLSDTSTTKVPLRSLRRSTLASSAA